MPQKKIEIDLKKVELLAARGLSFEQIATALGISDKTLLKRRRENSEVSEAIKRGKERGIAQVANKLFDQALAGNTTAMIFYLKTQAGWKETNRQELTGADGGAVQVEEKVDLAGIPLEKLLAAKEMLYGKGSDGSRT